MKIEIKKCELDDRNIKAVIALSKEWESEDLTYGYCANNKNDLIGNDLFLAYLNNEIVGYLFGKCSVLNEAIIPIDKGSKCFEINEIYVKEKYRSQGIGKALFEYTENYHKQNVDYITLSTATKNYKNILNFYIEKMDMSFWSAKLFKKI
ncbi:GNAT family N-acetyltransferase [Eubacterium sp.]|uniref:GNAT family N-acetyltransferase n=1 Tax=Eubacterium sp. TaxID=142586 RepID=UPI0025BBB153|nr:GNAT family N-acetyltransferase [Eubacterium sp.]MCI7800225.1 GNAT family N-acetyltransferase [Eubacterium sp.]